MDSQTVIDYLQAHPDFFKDHLEVLDKLQLPHGEQGAISLVEVQLERQRKRIAELETELNLLGRLALQDRDIFLALMPLQQQLSTCHNLTQGVQALAQWAQRYQLQGVKILLFTDAWKKHPSIPEACWLDRNAFELIRLERFGLRKFYLGELNNKEKSLLFLPEELPVGSVACCLLDAKTSQKSSALLVFKARDTEQFHNGQDIRFLQHFVSIMELHLHRWLANFI